MPRFSGVNQVWDLNKDPKLKAVILKHFDFTEGIRHFPDDVMTPIPAELLEFPCIQKLVLKGCAKIWNWNLKDSPMYRCAGLSFAKTNEDKAFFVVGLDNLLDDPGDT